jgi:hypothetical protein
MRCACGGHRGRRAPAIVGSTTPYLMCQAGRDRYRLGPWNNAGTGDRARPAMVGWEGPCPRGPSNISCTEDCALPGGRSPARFFQSPRTATLQGGLSSSMKGARWTVPLPGNHQIKGTLRHLAAWEGPRPRGPQGRPDHGRFCGTCNATQTASALASSDRWGGTAFPPSARMSGTDDSPPRRHRPTVGILRHWPAREGPRPRGPQGRADHGRFCGTCNATQTASALASSDRSGGTAPPPSAGMSGAEDHAPPAP